VLDRFLAIPGALEQMAANRGEAIVTGASRRKPDCARRTAIWPVNHGVRDRVVEGDHGIGGHALEQPVEREDLRPVRIFRTRCFVVQRGDRSLQLIRADRSL
jgi:hypothetical protein